MLDSYILTLGSNPKALWIICFMNFGPKIILATLSLIATIDYNDV